MNAKRTITRAAIVATGVGLVSGWAVYSARGAGQPAPIAEILAMASPEADSIVVQVNGQAVTQGDVNRVIDALVGEQLGALPADALEEVRAQAADRVVEDLITEKLLAQAAEKRKLSVSQEEIDSSMKRVAEALPPGESIASYAAATGTSEAEIKQQLTRNLRIEKLLEQETANVQPPTDAEVEAFYASNAEMFKTAERVRPRHVLIATAPGEDAESKQEKQKQAEAVRDKIVATKAENFAEVAAAESDCPSKKDGGNLGLVERGQTVPEFEEAIFSQKVGEVGPVVETPFGYHIVQVQERVPAGVVPLNEVRAAIAQQIDAERKQAAVDKYLSGLRARASIIRPEKEVKEAA